MCVCVRVCVSERVGERAFVDSKRIVTTYYPCVFLEGGYGSGVLSEKSCFVDNLLVRIHLIIQMIKVDRPCAMVV